VTALRTAPDLAAELDRLTDYDLIAARAIVARHGHDSISSFILRPDKTFQFGGGAVLAYRVIGQTAIVSGDPVGPDAAVTRLLAGFIQYARRCGWRVVLWAASSRHLASYRDLGLRAVCVGEEAVVDPAAFTLAGRPVRKLRQSVHRVKRRGWEITACDGRELDARQRWEMDEVEAAWRARHSRTLGFAMAMGEFSWSDEDDDLYLLARSPEGRLGGVMHFISHCGRLSLDTMHRVGETPNGLNEALVCAALEVARERGISEVSLNYAGLAHLIRRPPTGAAAKRLAVRLTLNLLSRRFQMQRLVMFNDKFSPDWRPRHLVFESRWGLPGAVLRVLQAEGYL
jgi:lysyl-tRNA synthetase, class II